MSKTIKFKSVSPYFDKEKSGIKPNTVRKTDDWDLERWELYKNAGYIQINNPLTNKGFVRKISDKSKWKNLIIISWNTVPPRATPDKQSNDKRPSPNGELTTCRDCGREYYDNNNGCGWCAMDGA